MKNNYHLTMLQFAASRFLINLFNENNNGLIVAVCGAGKTEMCFPLIKNSLNANLQFGFAIPRTDIVYEIYERLQAEFNPSNIGIRCGSKRLGLENKVLVLTTNQLEHYHHYFDILIIDEVDAFPFSTDPKFHEFAMFALKPNGTYYYLTSTPSETIKKLNLNTFIIYKRWHNKPLPVPKLHWTPNISKYEKLPIHFKLTLARRNRQTLIFIPTISIGEKISFLLAKSNIDHQFVHSRLPHRHELISSFSAGEFSILLTTTILERGVTFDDIDCIVYNADNQFFQTNALIQISGRVGRKKQYQNGIVIFYYSNLTTSIAESIRFIKDCNYKLERK